jgi:hypothetical protein
MKFQKTLSVRFTAMKRAQQSGQAAGLIALILLFIILYILFLPPENRSELLDDTSSRNGDDSSGIRESVLLTSPGSLEYLRESAINHTIPGFKLVSLTNSNILKQLESVSVSNSWFETNAENVTVYVENVPETENMLLSFSVAQGKGELRILFNGKEIFVGEAESGNIDPISIPDSLVQKENTLTFKASSVGIQFWKKNRYVLHNLQVIADQEDTSAKTSKNVFLVSNTEDANIEDVSLQYFIDCLSSEVGILQIHINGNLVSEQVPDCNSFAQLEVSPEALTPGENTIEFSIEKGSYSVYGIYINTELKEITNPVYYFELNDEEYEELTYGTSDLVLSMRFPDNQEDKVADILFNGHKIRLNQDDEEFEEEITDYIKEKNNAIKIVPQSKMDIVELEVRIE